MSGIRSGTRMALALAVVLLVACADGGVAGGGATGPDATGSDATGVGSASPTGPSPTGPSSTPSPWPQPVWLAGFRVEADSNALNADTQAIMEEAGPAIFAGPVACFQGIPAEFMVTPDAYVLGVIGPTRADVDAAVERVGWTPLFVVRATTMCVD